METWELYRHLNYYMAQYNGEDAKEIQSIIIAFCNYVDDKEKEKQK